MQCRLMDNATSLALLFVHEAGICYYLDMIKTISNLCGVDVSHLMNTLLYRMHIEFKTI